MGTRVRKHLNRKLAATIAALALTGSGQASAATQSQATATATVTVIQSINITTNSNLDFGSATPGDPALAVPPGTSENASNASFTVTGEPGKSFQIQLPSSAVNLTGPGGATIAVTSFQSSPATTAAIPSSGANQRPIYVGATRAAIPNNAPAGVYSGSFAVTVIYQ